MTQQSEGRATPVGSVQARAADTHQPIAEAEPIRQPARSVPEGITDIHEGDHLIFIAASMAAFTLLALPGGSLAPLWWSVAFLAFLFFLPRAWRRFKWRHVRLPEGGYLAFAKGRYLSGHAALIRPEEALLGLTEERVYLSTITGQLEGIHLLQVGSVYRGLEQIDDRGRTTLRVLLGMILRSPFLIFTGRERRDQHIVVVGYQFPSGMRGEMRFALDNRDVADQMLNMTNSAVQSLHWRMAQQMQPRSL